MRKFEVVSKVFGEGVLSIGSDQDWEFVARIPPFGSVTVRSVPGWVAIVVLSGTWRILSAECPADWHKEQAGMGMEDREDPFLTPPGKWLTIVTEIGEVLGFEIVREL